jgi:hypothetical protein
VLAVRFSGFPSFAAMNANGDGLMFWAPAAFNAIWPLVAGTVRSSRTILS